MEKAAQSDTVLSLKSPLLLQHLLSRVISGNVKLQTLCLSDKSNTHFPELKKIILVIKNDLTSKP